MKIMTFPSYNYATAQREITSGFVQDKEKNSNICQENSPIIIHENNESLAGKVDYTDYLFKNKTICTIAQMLYKLIKKYLKYTLAGLINNNVLYFLAKNENKR